MADISKITLPNGSSYDFKDSTARAGLAEKAASSHTHSEYALKANYGDNGLNLGRLADSTIGFLSSTMGRANAATGGYSFSQGFNNVASGVASFAGGQSSTADGENALAHGYFVQTTKNNEKAFGAYNKSSPDTMFSVGDGTAGNTRHNAFEITTTGGKLHDKDIATVDDIPEISELIYTIRFSEITWGTSGYGKYYYTINIPATTQIISANLGYWEGFYPDEVVQPTLSDSTTIELISNVAKATGLLAIRISYI